MSDLTITHNAEWETTGDDRDGGEPRNRLLATMWVNGCPCHLQAIRVHTDADHLQRACESDLDTWLDGAYMINGDGPFQTATIEVDGVAGEYVIVATSFS